MGRRLVGEPERPGVPGALGSRPAVTLCLAARHPGTDRLIRCGSRAIEAMAAGTAPGGQIHDQGWICATDSQPRAGAQAGQGPAEEDMRALAEADVFEVEDRGRSTHGQ
jgi:hypothetical protein